MPVSYSYWEPERGVFRPSLAFFASVIFCLPVGLLALARGARRTYAHPASFFDDPLALRTLSGRAVFRPGPRFPCFGASVAQSSYSPAEDFPSPRATLAFPPFRRR